MEKYRKTYEKETGFKVPKKWEVHHIDFDRENNHIDNLIAIPKKIHRRYHELIRQNMWIKKDGNTPYISLQIDILDCTPDHYTRIYNYKKIMKIYIKLKEFLIMVNEYFIKDDLHEVTNLVKYCLCLSYGSAESLLTSIQLMVNAEMIPKSDFNLIIKTLNPNNIKTHTDVIVNILKNIDNTKLFDVFDILTKSLIKGSK